MAKAKYWQKGNNIDYVNETDAVVEANTIIVIGSRVGIAGMDIGVGETGTLVMEGVFKMPKGNAEIAIGDNVYFNAESGVVTKTDTDTPLGYAVGTAAAAAAEVLVKLAG